MGLEMNPGMLGGLLLGAALGARKGGGMPAQQAPEPAPQPSVRPSPMDMLQQTTAGSPAGLASTYLTGPQGVDPKTVKTTKTSLYGN